MPVLERKGKNMSDFLRNIQLIEYEMLKEIDRIAKKHNIQYFLGCGTLIGAVKYKKFIPWDDDVDLLFFYKDLKKFIKVFKEEADPKYLVTNCFIEKHFPVAWSKVRNKETLSRPVQYKELPINWGICVDLFPLYSVSNNALLRKIEYVLYKIANKMLIAEFTRFEENHGFFVRLLEKIPISVRHLYFKMVQGILSLHGDNTKYILSSSRHNLIFEREEIFGGTIHVAFEDGEFPAPKNYDAYLTKKYGDWKAELPEDQKKGHELSLGDIEWKLP